jgi:acetoin utilization protein AcuB
MSPSPHSIGGDQTLDIAHAMMRKHGIRHLPVLSAGRLLGIVSQRDLYLVESLQDVDPRRVAVEEAMSQDVYRVSPDAQLQAVARTMTQRKYGCAVVMDQGHVVGMFTTVDALRALTGLLETPAV